MRVAIDEPGDEGGAAGIDDRRAVTDGIPDIRPHAGNPLPAGTYRLIVQYLTGVYVQEPGIDNGKVTGRPPKGHIDQFFGLVFVHNGSSFLCRRPMERK